jgi:hypothetical protein
MSCREAVRAKVPSSVVKLLNPLRAELECAGRHPVSVFPLSFLRDVLTPALVTDVIQVDEAVNGLAWPMLLAAAFPTLFLGRGRVCHAGNTRWRLRPKLRNRST